MKYRSYSGLTIKVALFYFILTGVCQSLRPGDNRSQRVRMEGWRQRRLGSKAKIPYRKREKPKPPLTLTGLLMEGPRRYSEHG